MNVKKIIWIVPIIAHIFFIISLLYYKIKSYLSISFNSFYLLTINIISLSLFHLSIEIEFFGSNKLFKIIFSIIFFFSYIIRIKRILDFLSLSNILKLKNIKGKEKSKILYGKAYNSFEISSIILLVFLSATTIYISYIFQIIIKEKHINEIIPSIVSILLIYKILSSEMKKKIKKTYSIEILVFFLLFSNCILFNFNFPQKVIFLQKILLYLTEILFIIITSINCKFFSVNHIYKQNCLINKKLNSDFSLFINNDLCFQSFLSFIRKKEKDSELMILLKLYLDINSYTLKTSIEEKNKDAENIINYFNNNKQLINNINLIENFEKLEKKDNDGNMFNEIYKLIYTILNKKYEEYKKDTEYKKLSAFLDIIIYLDEHIFNRPFYLEYFQNEELEVI